eukprot:jgi/Botrbrau1/7510/Bobra.0019s0001.1
MGFLLADTKCNDRDSYPGLRGPSEESYQLGRVRSVFIGIAQRLSRAPTIGHRPIVVTEPYRRDGSVQPPPPAELLLGEEKYEVDSIVAHRRANSQNPANWTCKYEYLVQWTGHCPEHNTWEPQGNLTNALEVLKSSSNQWRLDCGRRYPVQCRLITQYTQGKFEPKSSGLVSSGRRPSAHHLVDVLHLPGARLARRGRNVTYFRIRPPVGYGSHVVFDHEGVYDSHVDNKLLLCSEIVLGRKSGARKIMPHGSSP